MWKNVLFSDESSVKQFSAQEYRVWRPPGARYTEKFITSTAKNFSSQMIREDMSANGRAGLYFLPPESKIIGS